MTDESIMQRALELAANGLGLVEPNPMVGCVIVRDGKIIGEGFHQKFGGPHAEVNAIEACRAAGESADGATMYVTLEPCCHHGKTPPCTSAVIDAKISRVVIGTEDPFKEVSGGGIAILNDAGIEVVAGCLETEARDLVAPFTTLVEKKRPWIIAKWAMTLDGKIATASGDSQWISCEESRAIVHQIRGRMDAIIVGRGTAEADDPLLTARPTGPRLAARIVVDRQASLSLNSQLVKTAQEAPVIVACSAAADTARQTALQSAGCEVFAMTGEDGEEQLRSLFQELGRRQMMNVLVEGGGTLLGGLVDARLVDEVHAFVAPKLVGGAASPGPVAGQGIDKIASALELSSLSVGSVGTDIYIRGRL